ncbi:MAG: hypothetical protein WBK91_07495 [Alphaproteobacteria bacterium]
MQQIFLLQNFTNYAAMTGAAICLCCGAAMRHYSPWMIAALSVIGDSVNQLSGMRNDDEPQQDRIDDRAE